MTAPARPALRYHGSKWRIAPFILSHFPDHVCYVEPYSGSAAILLQKQPAKIEVYNDLGERVVNFFRVLRDRGPELLRAIELTPYSRAEFEQAREPADDALEAARRFFILSWQGRGGPSARWNSGWRYQRVDNRSKTSLDDWNNIDHLYVVAARLKQVHLECDDALKVIQRFDASTTLFYVDPPYLAETRSKWGAKNGHAYEHELVEDDHRRLAAVLHAIRGMAIISHYPCALYDDLYHDWQRESCAAWTDGATEREECIWISPAAAARAPQPALPFDEAVDGGTG